METICNNSGASISTWMEVELPSYAKLQKNLKVDVCIVGAGIAGLTCAYTLLKQGKSVVVLDRGATAGGQTARTSGHLTWILDDRYEHLIRLFGLESAKLAAESHAAAIDYIEKIVKEEKIDCDFARVDGYLFVPPHESKDILDKERDAINQIGSNVKEADRAPFSQAFDTGRCLQFPNQAEFHVLKYLKGLCKIITGMKGEIYTNTVVEEIEDGKVKTHDGPTLSAKSIIVATCSPINDRYYIHTKQAAYRTYMIAFKVKKGLIPPGLYWDTPDPYHYLRVQKKDDKHDWLLVGGEDHRTGQEDKNELKYSTLEKWARKRIAELEEVEFKWSGQVFEPVDSLAFIGQNPHDENVYIVTGDSGNGLTHGTIAGMLIPDLINKKSNPWEAIYKPSRKTLAAIKEFTEENVNTANQYLDWLTPGEKKKVEGMKPGEGILLREGLKKVAVYKDEKGKIHFNSARCPHLHGCVQWNSGEKSWDCPCHGSRFDGCGKAITGPAFGDLEKYESK